ncbi:MULTISPECIES: heparinase II/III domain-containing protein [unclassified Janthinobacterium]|uniref:heparinase II/III domain-containing protein n=1 Tax=unclassified Janthinobacterium TaxID=2610881 RepID=UPI00034B636E|nr:MULTISPECIES: heparinase II/III family protein [unclassified Janthinobacterium]MEC5159511.1 hypothetical protein [Janthinobacterium sp. CG_S6]
MNFDTIPLARMCAAMAIACAYPQAHADWAQSTEVIAVRPAPVNPPAPFANKAQVQNPPAFAWSRASGAASYELEYWTPSTDPVRVNVVRNWYLPPNALEIGTYMWRVRPVGTNQWTDTRTFSIDASSQTFEVPDSDTLKDIAKNRTMPRMLPEQFSIQADWSAAMAQERAAALTTVAADVKWRITEMLSLAKAEDVNGFMTPEPGTSAETLRKLNTAMGQRIQTAAHQLEAAALLHHLKPTAAGFQVDFLAEAIERGNQLAALDKNFTAVTYTAQDQLSRQIALALIKGVDLLYNHLDEATRKRWLANVTDRTKQMHAALTDPKNALDQYPFGSHATTNIGYLAAIATLSLTHIDEADAWFDFATRGYINSISAWSGPEGGFANGTAYAQYTAEIYLNVWPALKQATGVDLFKKPWSAGFVKYFAEFMPPGSSNNMFGDEHELKHNFAMVKSFASRVATPEAAWYVRNNPATQDSLALLQAPYPLPVNTMPNAVAPPNAALFQSIGWAAMHSDLNNTARTSLFFKSSPYGSYNHSHGDQNSIVLRSGGKPLLIEAGFEDAYESAMGKAWYRTTRAHNGVTFDGGKGQIVDAAAWKNMGYNGAITGFKPGADVDFAQGDAVAAYGAELTTARRQVWYLRGQDAVVVRDQLAGAMAHSFEWNVHAAVDFEPDVGSGVVIRNGDSVVCIRPIVENATFQRFVVDPAYTPKTGPEYHGAFVSTARGTSADFLMLLDVGCKRPDVTLAPGGDAGRVLTVGGSTITIPK